MEEGSVVVVCRRWHKNGCERNYYEWNRGGREEELTGEVQEGCRVGRRRNQRDGSLGCREAETAAGLWKIVNRLNSSAQTKSAQLFNFVDYLRSSSFFMSLSRCGIHL